MIIAIINQKGGVGKTTTTVNLGAALAEAGQRVLLVDLDAQQNASAICRPVIGDSGSEGDSLFDVLLNAAKSQTDGETRSGTSDLHSVLVPTAIAGVALAQGDSRLAGLETALRREARRNRPVQDAAARGARDADESDDPAPDVTLLARVLEPLRAQFDFVLIDNGPTLGLAPVLSLCAADMALVPLQCEWLALEGLRQVQHTIEGVQESGLNPGLTMRVLLTLFDRRTSQGREIVEAVRAAYGEAVCQAVVPRSVKLSDAVVQARTQGGSVLRLASGSPAAAAYRELAQELMQSAASPSQTPRKSRSKRT